MYHSNLYIFYHVEQLLINFAFKVIDEVRVRSFPIN